MMKDIHLRGSFAILLTLMAPFCLAATSDVGDVEFARGVVAAKAEGQETRALSKGSDVFLGDNIQTIDRSFAILKLDQGGKLTIRPNSSLSLDNPAPINLHKGGLRASSQKTVDQPMVINVGASTIKTEAAVYSVRVCEQDCAEDQKRGLNVNANNESLTVARIIEIKGEVTAINGGDANAKPRTLSLGSPLYSRDKVTTAPNSHTIIVFRDQGKLTLLPDSVLDISEYAFQNQENKDVANYNLVKGGLRVLTGIIGENNKEAFKVSSLVATMGIRGTGFDLLCQGDCVEDGIGRDDKSTKQLIEEGKAEGLYTYVWQGTITQTNAAGTFVLKEGESNYIANDKSQPQLMSDAHPVLQDNPAPRPDSVTTLFEMAVQQGVPPGIYVTVHDGNVDLITNDGEIKISSNMTGYIAPGEPTPELLEYPVAFQSQDPYPSPDNFDTEQAEIGKFSLLADSVEEEFIANGFVCELQ